jgi:hypothetical protein
VGYVYKSTTHWALTTLRIIVGYVPAGRLVRENDHEEYRKLLQGSLANQNPWAPPLAPIDPSYASLSQEQVALPLLTYFSPSLSDPWREIQLIIHG